VKERWRTSIRAFWMGILTVLRIDVRGFFIPYRYAALLQTQEVKYPLLETVFNKRRQSFVEVLDSIDSFEANLNKIGGEPPPAPRFDQGWFPTLDAAAAYALVRRNIPKRLVEVGSGHSTRFLMRALIDERANIKFTSIDPMPRADICGLPLELIRSTVQEVGTGITDVLESGDILFIDSSHVLMPGSDVDWVINQVFPSLEPGVLIHVHDIFLPDAYPSSWAWRGYNEQTAISALITNSPGYEVVFASHYVSARMSDLLARTIVNRLPCYTDSHASSLWLRKQ